MNKTQAFKDLLNSQHEWPCNYTFKFIVPSEKKEDVSSLFPNAEVEFKDSNQGAYVSLTATLTIESADVVIAIYEKAAMIDGLIAL